MTATPSPRDVTPPDIRRAGNGVFVSGIVLLVIWTLLPIYLLGVNALSSPEQINSFPKRFWPSFDLASLTFFVQFDGVLDALWNSVRVAAVTMILSIGCGAPAGYALARYDFRGQTVYRLLIVMTRAFPLAILALPLVTRFISVGLYDTHLGVALVHTALALPFSILVSSSLFMGIPRELEEAAWTLGCNRVQAFMKVVLPLALPGMAATMIFSFVISWNEVFSASVLTLNNRTLTAFLFASLEESPLHFRFAGGFFLILPSMLFIFVVRKYLFSMWGISNR
jgi:multiple sugar transport system permease protein